jgi:hypothetical protein
MTWNSSPISSRMCFLATDDDPRISCDATKTVRGEEERSVEVVKSEGRALKGCGELAGGEEPVAMALGGESQGGDGAPPRDPTSEKMGEAALLCLVVEQDAVRSYFPL